MGSLLEQKIAAEDFADKDVSSIEENMVVGRAEWLKARFDSAAKEVITPKVNGLIDALLSEEAAGQIGAAPLMEGSEATVAGQMAFLKEELNGVSLGQIPSGSLTDDKLSDAPGQLKDTVAAKLDKTQLATAEENGVMSSADKRKLDALDGANLLINGGFAVWQRGESFTFARTGYGGGGYAADRWRVWANADGTGGNIVVTKAADGMHVESDGVCHTTYRFEPEDGLAGKTVCVSMSVDGEIQTWVVTVADGSTTATSNTITLPLPQSGTVNWIKAELGEEATPFVPRSYGEELLACMRYYQKTGTVFCPGYITVGGASFTYMPPVPMRIVPTIGGNVNDITVRPVDSDVIYEQTVGISASQSSGDALYLTTTAPGVTANRPCVVQFSGLTLSAELMAEGGTVG